MSRGPGIWQRAILRRVERGELLILTGPDQSHAEQNAIRRAAYALEQAGRIQLVSHRIDGRPRLVACPLEMSVPTNGTTHGLDGKRYRRPV